MRKYYTILFLFISLFAFSQNNGINFQGVARNSSGAVLASQKISLRFTVIQGSETGSVEYVESKEVTTNAQGIFSVVIGDGTQISKTGNFTDINWKINPKFLKVEMDPAGSASFAAMGTTRLQSVPFAYYANGVNADNVEGVLSASKGGTGVASISALKTALGADQINNTSDLAKPISTATQVALDLKVDKINGKQLSTNDYTSAEKNKLEAISGTNTGDQDISGLATISQLSSKANTSDLALKAPLESPTFTGTVNGISKAMVGLSNVDNTADLAKPISSATQTALDMKVAISTFLTTVATKENAVNKSTATDLGAGATSDILFPTQKAVKTYVDTQVNAGGVADGGILTRHLADGAVTDAKIATGIDKAKVGLANVDNTADALKPISTATQEALDEKLSTMVFDDRLRNIAKLDESNYFTSEQNIFSGNQIVIGELTLPNGILNLSAGTQILSGIDSPTTIQNRANKDFTIKTSIDEEGDGDPGEYEFKFTADGRLLFPDGGSRIIIDESQFEDRNVFSIRSKKDSYIQLRTNSEGEEEGPDDDIINYWEFQTDGKLVFPDGTIMRKYVQNEDFSIFEINSPTGISLQSSHQGYDGITNLNAAITIVPEMLPENLPDGEGSKGNILMMTRDLQPDEEGPSAQNIWKYDYHGILTFPDGTAMGKIALDGPEPEIEYQAFGLTSPSGIILGGGDPMSEETTGIASIGISQQGSQGKILITTREIMNDSNMWEFDSKGLFTFPDGTTLAGSYSGSTDFEFKVIENSGFKISTFQNDEDSKTLEFNVEGILTLPLVEMEPSDENLNEGAIAIAKPSGWDPLNKGGSVAYPVFYNGTDWVGLGSSVAAGTSTPTSILYVDQNTNTNYNTILANENGFKFQVYQDGVGLEHEWSYNMDGSLKFPDGTIASGNISDTGNFGIDTRVTENGFSIITGNLSGANQLWSFGSNGETIFPGNGKISMNDDDDWNNALQINSPSALRIVTSTSQYERTWHFTADGNTYLPGNLELYGNIHSGGNIYNAGHIFIGNGKELKIGDYYNSRNALDNILKEQFAISSFNISNPNNIIWTLQFDPRTINSVSIYINGLRISNSDYEKVQNRMIKYKGSANFQLNDRIQIDYQY